ncbi:MAG: trimethylamine methyltransferase family protein [Anaerolineae bacterium]|nr:trimethylamine methyltransferase family protein [Anaerolineae bacterium]MDW8071195.1 trimethylamine methyltransferase family protein [Anaerolineae bacterium]
MQEVGAASSQTYHKTRSAGSLRISILDEAHIEYIHTRSLRVLEEVGIVIRYPPARQLLQIAGARTDEARQRVYIPHRLVELALQSAPRRVTVYGGHPAARGCHLYLDGPQYARTTTGLNWILDHRAARRRPVTAKDTVNWTRLIHRLPNIHLAGSLIDQEAASRAAEVRCLARMVHHTDKPFVFSAFSGEGMRWLWRMSQVAQGNGRLPRLMVLSSVNSPLTYGWGQCEAAMVSAELGIPVLFNSSAVAGVTAPVTLAGAVVQINAEMLAALTIIQLHRPGAPVVYAAHPMAFDMRAGMASISVAEVGLMSAACVQMGRYYGLPTASNGICTDTCTPDAMATLEKWASGYLPAIAGANLNGGAGSLACVGTVSLEQLVIDSDLYGHIFRQARGLTVDEETLAFDAIARVGPGRDYLIDEHTLRHFREEFYFSSLANRLSAPAWEAAGSRDTLERAHQVVEEILAQPETRFLSEEQSREIDRLLKAAEETLATLEIPT